MRKKILTCDILSLATVAKRKGKKYFKNLLLRETKPIK